LKTLLACCLLWLFPGVTHAATADIDTLRALHARVIQAHLERNPNLIVRDETADYLVANRGVITRPSLQDRRDRFTAYFASTRFASYVDLVEPVVEVSADGTLGWVVVQVEAKGVQTGDDGKEASVAFVSAWIELYQKRDGRWFRTGNVSNFKP